jgi:RPA family protein
MTAVKLRIRELVEGSWDGRNLHTIFGELSEVRILGTLIDVFITDDDSYTSLTVDDGTETVRIKAWRQDVEKLKEFLKGDLIEVVGKVREYNEEIYLTPELVSKVTPNKWVLRELELMKLYLESGAAERVQEAPVAAEEEPDISESAEPDLEGPPAIEETGPALTHEGKETKEEILEKKEIKEKVLEEEKEVSEDESDLDEIEEFEILGEDEAVETVLELLQKEMTKETLIQQSGLDEIDVELSLRELLDEGRITKEGNTYKKVG